MIFESSLADNLETRTSILHAFGALLREKGYSHVTVSDICAAAPCSKSTFYRNFEDKFSIVEWRTQRLLAQSVYNLGRTMSWREAYLVLLREFAQHRDFFVAAMSASGNRSVRSSNKVTAIEYLQKRAAESVSGTDKALLLFQARYFAGMMVDVIGDWTEHGMSEAPEILVDRLMTMVPKALHDALELA